MEKKELYISGQWYGHDVSDYGKKEGFVDYRTFASAFNHILCNGIIENTWDDGWELVNGDLCDEEGCGVEVFQWYIVDHNGAEIIQNWTDEILYYNEELDIYVWGITHFGTAWDYVLTSISWYKTKVLPEK